MFAVVVGILFSYYTVEWAVTGALMLGLLLVGAA